MNGAFLERTQSALAAAAQWPTSLVVGTVGTTLAILAIAICGFTLLQGRLSLRLGARVILGCFILFGSPVLASAMIGLVRPDAPSILPPLPPPAPPLMPPPPPTTQDVDPYAGASVPM